MDAEYLDSHDPDFARELLAARWRADAATVLGFAGALLVSQQASSVDDALAQARSRWEALLRDAAFGECQVSLPPDSAVEALRQRLLRGGR